MAHASPRRPSGYLARPDYRIDLVPTFGREEAWIGPRRLASSRDALRLDEQGHSPVVYFPRADVDVAVLRPIPGRSTHCPFKGDAAYFALADTPDAPVAWTYPDPYPEVAAIAGLIAFYAR